MFRVLGRAILWVGDTLSGLAGFATALVCGDESAQYVVLQMAWVYLATLGSATAVGAVFFPPLAWVALGFIVAAGIALLLSVRAMLREDRGDG